MKRRIISVVLIITAVVCASLFQNTLAWFTAENYSSTSFIVGDVDYELTYTAGEDTREFILPGDEVLLGDLILTNNSTIETQIRFKVVDSVNTDAIDSFNATFAENSLWVYSKADGFFYYGTDETMIPKAVAETGDKIDFIQSITYNGAAIEKEDYSGVNSTVTLKFQAKQGEYAAWTDIGEFKI